MRYLWMTIILLVLAVPALAEDKTLTVAEYFIWSGNPSDTLGRTRLTPDSIRIAVVDSSLTELYDAWFEAADAQCALNGDIIAFSDQWGDINGASTVGHFSVTITIASDAQGNVDVYTNYHASVECVTVSVEATHNEVGKILDSVDIEIAKIRLMEDTGNTSLAKIRLIEDTVNAIIDSTQSQDNWVAKEASLFDPATDSTIVDGSEFAILDGAITSTTIATDAIGALEFSDGATGKIVDSTYEEVLTGATHNKTNSAGKILRQIKGGSVIHDGTSDNVPANAANSFSLETGGGSPTTSTIDNFYNHQRLAIVGGTGEGQVVMISDYTGSNQVVTTVPAFLTVPDATSVYEILPGLVHAETIGGGYEGGAVWVSSTGSTGTQLYVDGTIDNPIDDASFANAKTVADALNLSIFRIADGASITLATTYNNYSFIGDDWTLALGGQDLALSNFTGATVSGTATGASVIQFFNCFIGDIEIAPSNFFECGFSPTSTDSVLATGAGQYLFRHCYSVISGTVTPKFSMGDAVGNTKFGFRDWDGGLTLSEIGSAGDDSISIEGRGKIIMDATNAGGIMVVRGNFSFDISAASTSITRDAALNGAYIADVNWNELVAGHSTALTYGDSLPKMLGLIKDTADVIANKIDSVTTAIADANKGNFKASGFSTFDPSTTAVVPIDTNSNGDTTGLAPSAWTVADTGAYQGAAGSLDSATVSRAVWNSPQANHTIASSFGKYLDIEVSSVSASSGTGPNAMTFIAIDSSADDTLSGVNIGIYNAAGTQLVNLRTASDGSVNFNCPSGVVQVVTELSPAYIFDDTTYTTSNNDTVAIYGYSNTQASPANPNVATVFNYEYDIDGTVLVGAIVSLRRMVPDQGDGIAADSSAGLTLSSRVMKDTTDATGYWSLSAYRTGQYTDTTVGFYYLEAYYGSDQLWYYDSLYVPATGNVNMSDKLR